MKNYWIITIVLVLVIATAAFFGGMQYQKAQPVIYSGQGGMMQARRFGGQFGNVRPVRGQIISADSNTITVKMTDGSSKIIILSGNTSIMEATSAGKEALQTGKQVMVFGNQNADGSLTAQNIQLNPLQMRGVPSPAK